MGAVLRLAPDLACGVPAGAGNVDDAAVAGVFFATQLSSRVSAGAALGVGPIELALQRVQCIARVMIARIAPQVACSPLSSAGQSTPPIVAGRIAMTIRVRVLGTRAPILSSPCPHSINPASSASACMRTSRQAGAIRRR